VKDSTWMIETERDQRVLIVELSKRDDAEHWPLLLKVSKRVSGCVSIARCSQCMFV
jgi:hypothetical protein